MVQLHLMDNSLGPPTVNYPPGASHIGTVFTTGGHPVTHLGFHKGDAVAGNVPNRLTLFDKATGSLLRYIEDFSAVTSAAGWKYLPLASPYWPSTTQQLVVGVYQTGSKPQSYTPTSSYGTPPVPLTVVDKSSDYQAAADPNLMPDTDWGLSRWVDVVVDTALGPDNTDQVTGLVLQETLDSWLNSDPDENTHQTGLPWLTHALATAIDESVGDTKSMVEGLVAIGIGVKLGDAQTALDGLEAFLYSVAPDSLKSYLDGLESDVRGPGAPTIADVVTAVGNIQPGVGLPPGPVSVENGWTMREEVSGVGKIKWDEPADAYILVRTGWDADRQVNIYEGVTYFFDRGWWAPHQADVVEGYGTLAAATHLLRVPTGRMSGVLIVQDDDFAFDLQAWDAPS